MYFFEHGVGEARGSVFHKGACKLYPDDKVRRQETVRNVQIDNERTSYSYREGTVPLFHQLAALGDEPLVGKPLPREFKVKSQAEKLRLTEAGRAEYDLAILQDLVYHTYPGEPPVRPAARSVEVENKMTLDQATELLEGLIDSKEDPKEILEALKDKYILIDGQLVSVYVHFKTVLLQTRMMHAKLEANGKPYTLPLMGPAEFALEKGNPTFSNRLHCLAYQFIGPEKFKNLAVLAPNAFGEKGRRSLVGLYQGVFSGTAVKVKPMSDIYGRDGSIIMKNVEGFLVQQANSDALADNFHSEGGDGKGRDGVYQGSSQEAAVGAFVRAGFGKNVIGRLAHVFYLQPEP